MTLPIDLDCECDRDDWRPGNHHDRSCPNWEPISWSEYRRQDGSVSRTYNARIGNHPKIIKIQATNIIDAWKRARRYQSGKGYKGDLSVGPVYWPRRKETAR
jgi:hypothetical protein